MKLSILIIICLVFTAILIVIVSKRERSILSLETYRFYSKKLTKPYRFVFLSDLHEVQFGADNERLLSEIDRLQPDFVLIGGDMIRCHKLRPWNRRRHTDSVEVSCRFLEQLKKRYIVYYAVGNHEERLWEKAGRIRCTSGAKYDTYIKNMAEKDAARLTEALEGVQLLDNAHAFVDELEITGLTLELSFFRSLLTHRRKALKEADITDSIGRPTEGKYQILLLHSPMYYHEAIRHGMDLVLSGHYHGGMVRIPGIGALITPQFELFVRECAGLFHDEAGSLIVNRGLGTHSINLRINNTPEITLVTLAPASEQKEHGTGINL